MVRKIKTRTKEEQQIIDLFLEDYDLHNDEECYIIYRKLWEEVKEHGKR